MTTEFVNKSVNIQFISGKMLKIDYVIKIVMMAIIRIITPCSVFNNVKMDILMLIVSIVFKVVRLNSH